MTLSSLFIVCSHGRRSPHVPEEPDPDVGRYWCPGGRPATLEDLGGEKVWWCAQHQAIETAEEGTCEIAALWDALFEATRKEGSVPVHNQPCDISERILIPLPQLIAGESQ